MTTYTAFANEMWLASGSREHVAETLRAMAAPPRANDLLVFDDATGAQIDLDLRPQAEEPAKGPGRPRLGVVAREVTLLPRHWDWLAAQRGGASAVLRRLIESAMRETPSSAAGKDAAYRFLTAIAGDRAGFEDAIRALYADDRSAFDAKTADWPSAVRNHAVGLAWAE